ncbi:MAG: hypothetical protein IT318_27130 [Anaerolineales bacterium]|nr:hypothetical protein [Anaerolineales bacterium]
MSHTLRWRTAFTYVAAIGLGLALGPALSWLGGWLRPPAVQAAEVAPAVALAPDSPQAVHTCTPDYIANFTARVHVRCTVPAETTIYYFATPNSNSKNAARVLSILLTAESLGRNVRIYYTSSANGSAYGCQFSDCRPIDAAELMP